MKNKKMKYANVRHIDNMEEIEMCKSYIIQFPFIFDKIFINGNLNMLLFKTYVQTVYNNIRHLRPDILKPLAHMNMSSSDTITSVTEACRILHLLVAQFPCMFVLR